MNILNKLHGYCVAGEWYPFYPITRVRGNFMRFTWTKIYSPTIPGWAFYDLRPAPSPSELYTVCCIYKKIEND